MSSFVIKLIAICSMFCDHAGDSLIGHFTFLNVIGRIAFPLFAFQIVIGFVNTSNIKKYLSRMFVFAIISQIPYQIFITGYTGEKFNLNVFFTLACGLISLIIVNKQIIQNKFGDTFIKIIFIGLICTLAQITKCDYGAIGILIILLIYFTYPYDFKKENDKINYQKLVLLILGAIVLCMINYRKIIAMGVLKITTEVIVAAVLPIIFMLAYNGKKGKSLKYFFYAFYPVHLIILDIIHYFLS